MPRIRPTNHRFYHYGWYYHFKHAAPKLSRAALPWEDDPIKELHITAASVGTHKGQAVFTNAVNDVVQQVIRNKKWTTNFCRSIADPCLQAVDYCTWAIQRKWERADLLSYDLIKDKIIHEPDMWSHGEAHHY